MRDRITKIRNTYVGNVHTPIPGVITENPWLNGYQYGMGINIITGEQEDTAVKPFTVNNPAVGGANEKYALIQSEDDYTNLVDVSASGSFNINGVNANASASYLNSVEASDVSMTLFAQYTAQYGGYETGSNYGFTSDAQKVLDNEGEKGFRAKYGDYFISGSQKESVFTCLYVLKSSSVSDMQDFKAAMGADAPKMFSAEASTNFKNTADQYNISISYVLCYSGIEGAPPVQEPYDPAKILQVLDWFKANEVGAPTKVQLTNYSQVSDVFKNSIKISPDVFSELSFLYKKYWLILTNFASIPNTYQQQYQDMYDSITSNIKNNQAVLANDKTMRDQYRDDADQLLNALYAILNRMSFYFSIADLVSSEPANGDEIVQENGTRWWGYGSCNGSYASASEVFKMDWKVGRQESTVSCSLPTDITPLIIGWEVTANRDDDHNGSWWKACDQILLTSNNYVHFKSEYDRGCDWTLVCYYVNAADYQFADL